jgi:hypothetical protein
VVSRDEIRDALAGLGVIALVIILTRPGGPGHTGVVAAGEALISALL